jgi:ATP-dependent DNA helicase RecG
MKPRIRVFTNRIEFENPGSLPRPIKELMREDISLPRNPVLAKLFRCAKLCEGAGYGIDKMLYWKKFSNGKVLFESTVDKTKVTFTLNRNYQKLPETTRNYQKLPETTEKNINGIEEKILEILKLDGSISRSNMAKKIGISNDLAKYYIDKLKKSNRIKREGADRGGIWVVYR